MHLKVFLKLKKTLKPSLLGKKTQKNPKKTQKPKKTHWAGFLYKKTRVFPNPDLKAVLWIRDILVQVRIRNRGYVRLTCESGSGFFRQWLTK
jgi:hypothetical protein